MDPPTRIFSRETTFWAAATLSVPVLLSVALLLTLVLEMSITANGFHHLTARFIAIAIVEALIGVGFAWGIGRSSDRTAGVAVASAIVGIILLAGLVLTL